MAWYWQILIGFATLISAPLGVKLLDYLIVTFKNWWNKRKDRQISDSQNQQELDKLRILKDIDTSKVRRDDFEMLKNTLSEIASDATKRAHTAEEKNLILQTKLEDFELKIDSLGEEVKCCVVIREQMEIDERLMYDTFNVAYWEVTPDGRVFGNATFLRLTGLSIAKCHNDGWFEAIEESARNRCRNFWEAFIENHQTRPALPFTFRNVETGCLTQTTVFCGARMRSITDVYKYTARTKPLILSPAMNVIEDDDRRNRAEPKQLSP